ncbi:MAG: hypothetical protein ACRDUX_25625 [Mycobacterium sp.]
MGVKALSGLVGATALVAMGMLVVAQDRAPAGAVTAASMTMGQTTTQTVALLSVPPSAVVIPIASPTLKAKRPKGF